MTKKEIVENPSKERSRVVNLRVPVQVIETIDDWVNTNHYKSRSEFILYSIRFYLDYIEYKESYNVRTFQGEQVAEIPRSRFERLKYLKRP